MKAYRAAGAAGVTGVTEEGGTLGAADVAVAVPVLPDATLSPPPPPPQAASKAAALAAADVFKLRHGVGCKLLDEFDAGPRVSRVSKFSVIMGLFHFLKRL